MTNSERARKTAEKAIENMGIYIDWSEVSEGFFPTDNLASLILSALNEAVKEKDAELETANKRIAELENINIDEHFGSRR